MEILLTDIVKGKVVIVGIGNILRGDDGFGPYLIEKIKDRVPAVCIDAGSAPENYAGKIVKEKPDTIILVDVVHLDLAAGKYEVLKGADIINSGFSTHDMSPRMFIKYLESQTKAEVYLLGVQPEGVSFGDEMSDVVKKSLDDIAELFIKSGGK